MISSYEQCQYNWEQDIKNALPPPSVSYDPAEYTPEELNRSFNYKLGQPYCLVTADPNDSIILMNDLGMTTEYPAHCNVWQNTIDHYLCEYYMLSRKKYGESVVSCILTDKMQEKLRNYIDAASDRQKSLPQNIHLGNRRELNQDSTCFLLPAFAPAEYRNQFYRWIDTFAKAPKRVSSIEYDGLPFVRSGCKTAFPFTIIDYIEHEYQTGVSLSIEVTAILLEIKPVHRDEVLDAFVQNAMPAIIRCPYLFTRNTVARQYIQQIIMERYLLESTLQNPDKDQLSSCLLYTSPSPRDRG